MYDVHMILGFLYPFPPPSLSTKSILFVCKKNFLDPLLFGRHIWKSPFSILLLRGGRRGECECLSPFPYYRRRHRCYTPHQVGSFVRWSETFSPLGIEFRAASPLSLQLILP